jgi:hypothetical protein
MRAAMAEDSCCTRHGGFLRLAQLAEHIQVVEGCRDALAEHFQQVALDLGQRPGRRHRNQHVAVFLRVDVEHIGRVVELALLFLKGLADGRP